MSYKIHKTGEQAMRVLWSVNAMPSELLRLSEKRSGTYSGGWLEALKTELVKQKGTELYIAVTAQIDRLSWYQGQTCVYVIVPSKSPRVYEKSQEKFWNKVLDYIKPDVVHIHGTEHPHSLCLFHCAKGNYPTVISLQGIVSEVHRAYLNGISKTTLRLHTTPRDVLLGTTIGKLLSMYRTFAKYETELLSQAENVIGRTDWDKQCVQKINPSVRYYVCNESMRTEFYDKTWEIEKISRYTILFSQAVYPLKGLHRLLDALAIVKKQIPNVKVFVAGENMVYCPAKRLTAYGSYLKRKIKKLRLQKNIQFTGVLSAEEYARALQQSHLFVLASSVENSSNSLCEAMLVGTPSIASSTGGTPSLIVDGENGLLFNINNTAELNEKILSVFGNDDFAKKLSSEAKNTAVTRHNAAQNAETMMKIYEDLIG